jgi:hypothetical protein
MKKNHDTKKPGRSGKVGDLLQKLRELDEKQLEDVNGGRGRCGSQCMDRCN